MSASTPPDAAYGRSRSASCGSRKRFLNQPVARVIAGVGGAATACAIAIACAAPTLAATHPTAPTSAPVSRLAGTVVHMSAKDLAQWRHDVATPAGRDRVIAAIKAAFGNVAKVGTGAMPAENSRYNSVPDVAVGVTGDHVWIIVSYADIVDGAIWSGVAACAAYIPEASDLCEEAGELLVDWGKGWGRASNHGVWAAIYWWPPHVTGGRW
jgi:hypothetical protein